MPRPATTSGTRGARVPALSRPGSVAAPGPAPKIAQRRPGVWGPRGGASTSGTRGARISALSQPGSVAALGPAPIIVGAGRLGTVLGGWLASAGVPIAAVASRTRTHARRGARRAGAASAWDWTTLLEEVAPVPAPVIVLAIPDDALAPAAAQLVAARRDWRGAVVLHTSGALPAAILRPLQRRGAAIGSMHPMMTFPPPGRPAPSPARVVFSLEGDADALRLMRAWVRRFRGRELRLTPDAKAAFHAAATLLGPGSVVLMAAAERHLRDAGLSGARLQTARDGLATLLLATAAGLGASPTAATFTGPWARGDSGTVRRHRRQWTRKTDRRLHQALIRTALELLRKTPS